MNMCFSGSHFSAVVLIYTYFNDKTTILFKKMQWYYIHLVTSILWYEMNTIPRNGEPGFQIKRIYKEKNHFHLFIYNHRSVSPHNIILKWNVPIWISLFMFSIRPFSTLYFWGKYMECSVTCTWKGRWEQTIIKIQYKSWN